MHPLPKRATVFAVIVTSACLRPGGTSAEVTGDAGQSGSFRPLCDGGPPSDAGSWAIAGYQDCACRCPGGTLASTPADPFAGDINNIILECSPCFACACQFGLTDLTSGCVFNSDCALVPADCCGCEVCGSSTAILAQNRGLWLTALQDSCGAAIGTSNPRGGGCSYATADGGGCILSSLCSAAVARCLHGRCVMQN
jgi:hypothetical protein